MNNKTPKYIPEWHSAIIAETRESTCATVSICTNDLLTGEALKRQAEKISDYAFNVLYRQNYEKKMADLLKTL
jgi:hypothetical protein